MDPLDELSTIARRHLPLAAHDALAPDAELFELGLGSLAFAAFLVDVEETFDVVFPAEAIQRETFRTLRTTATAVVALRDG